MGTFVRILLLVFIPPLGVLLTVGLRGHFWLNLLLTLFGYIPGLIHGIWLFMKKDEIYGKKA